MRTSLALPLAVVLLAAGCVQDVEPAATPPGTIVAAPTALAFSAPVELTGEGHGYEPGIEVDAYGTLYVTAHKGNLAAEGARLSSWLWFSRDNGATWQEMPAPLQQHDKLPGVEGDLALDGKGRLYFVDTYLFDNTISSWTTGPDGPAWESTRLLQGTTATDDRPWLAAHGDGILYYLGNNGRAALPAPEDLLDAKPSAIWLYRSSDGGASWSLGHGFPDVYGCTLDASRADDQTVHVGCYGGDRAIAFRSADRGATWTVAEVGVFQNGAGANYPSVALDRAGAAYYAAIDGWPGVGEPGRVMVARTLDGQTWEPHDATPFNGTFGMVWISGGDPGTVAVTFYATEDLDPGPDSEWHAHLLLGTGLDGAQPRWEHVVLDPEPVRTGAFPPQDFFQNVFAPDGAIHIVYQRDPPGALAGGLTADVLHVRQLAGPNLPPAPAPS